MRYGRRRHDVAGVGAENSIEALAWPLPSVRDIKGDGGWQRGAQGLQLGLQIHETLLAFTGLPGKACDLLAEESCVLAAA